MNVHDRPLSGSCKFLRPENAVAAGTSDVDGDVIDMSQDGGYDGILLIVLLNTVVDASELTLSLRGSDSSDGSSSEEEAATETVVAATSSNKIMLLDVLRPEHRYVFSRIERDTQNATIDGVIAMLYRGRETPVTQDAVVLAEAMVSIL